MTYRNPPDTTPQPPRRHRQRSTFTSHLIATSLACLLCAPSHVFAQTETARPAESLDLVTIARIRDEGLNHSHVMDYATELADGVGPRLTGSPGFEQGAQWAVEQLKTIGIADAHTESWGDFGMAWTQIRTTLLLDAPYPATLVAQATPWSPSTHGEVSAPVLLLPTITDRTQLGQYKGKLRGKVLLYGLPPKINPSPKAPLVTVDEEYFRARMDFPLDEQPKSKESDTQAATAENLKDKLKEEVGRFLADEGALAVLVTSHDEANTFHNDTSPFGNHVFLPGHKQPVPSAVVAPDAYGRLARLAERQVPITVKLNIESKFGTDHADGENVLGDLAGTDPALRNQVVMLGAHLDSWASATGATDDGAGVIIALEALRILKAVGVSPRRTVRVGLWGGEEEGEIGSMRYLSQHLANVTRAADGPWANLPDWDKPVVRITPKPDFNNMDVYFNTDAGGGRVLGIYTGNNLAAASIFRQWVEPLRDLGFSRISLLYRRGIDVERFDELGLPGFQLMQDLRDYDTRTHHTNLDTYERLSEPDLKQAATVMAVLVFNAAQRDAMIPRK